MNICDVKEYWENRILPYLIIKESGCWEWNRANSKGYGQIRVTFGKKKSRMLQTHRISKMYADGKIYPSNLEVCHICDNPKCNNPNHLFVGIHADNVADMHKKNRGKGMYKPGHTNGYDSQIRGTRCANSKLNDDKVREIFRLHKHCGLGHKRIAKIIGVSPAATRSVLKRRTWAHVDIGSI
jgi:hypothetical protein